MVQLMNASGFCFNVSAPNRMALPITTIKRLALVAAVCLLVPLSTVAAPTISYVQGNYATPQSTLTTVTVAFNSAETAGNLNVVVVGWNDSTATVSSVTDSSGNI